MSPKTLDRFELPTELVGIPRAKLQFILPDLSIKALKDDVPSCSRVRFAVTYHPGMFPKDGWVQVPIEIKDTRSAEPPIRMTISMSAKGETREILVGWWPTVSDAKFTPDYTTTLRVTVDPDHLMAERNEANNVATFDGTCIG